MQDCSEFDEKFNQTNLHEFKLVQSLEQHETLPVLLGVILAPVMCTNGTLGMVPHEGNNTYGVLLPRVELCQGTSESFSNINLVHEFSMLK